MQRRTVDVAIIGGGIMGCSTALHLRRRGRSVAVLERGAVGAQASGVNFGNVRRQGRFLPQLPLAMRSSEMWNGLGALIGEDCEYEARGNLLLAFSDEHMAQAADYAEQARDWGLHLELFGAESANRRWPWLTGRVRGAAFCPGDGAANPRLVTPAFARTAVSLGAEIFERTEVVDVARDGACFVVTASNGLEVRADCLVNTAGAWSGKIAAAFGEPVPLTASGPQMGVTEPVRYFVEPTISVVGHSIYFRQVARGNIVFGGGDRGPASAETRRAYVLPENTRAQVERVAGIAPALAGCQVIRVWSGIEGYLPDNIPVIGPSLRVPGLFHAFGFCGHGFQLGPAVGAVLSEWIVDGHSATPIDAFSIGRFAATA